MHDPVKHSDHIISIVSQLNRISRNKALQLDEESFAGLLQDLGNAFRCSLEMEEELKGLRHLRNVVAEIAKSNGHVSVAEKRRATFEVVGGTDAPTPKARKETGNV